MMAGRLVLVVTLMVMVGAFFYWDLGAYLTLESLKAQQTALDALVAADVVLISAVFFVVYVLVTALSIPGAAIMTLAAGGMFGLGLGLLIVSFASTIGATLAMLVSRYLLRDQVQRRFQRQMDAINEGVKKDGAFYLFTLRLVPIFPFFVVNLLMGLTNIRVLVYFIVSQIGMLAGTIVYVNAGTQLAQVSTLSDIVSPALLGSFVLLGLFPLLAKKLMDWIRVRRVYRGFLKPAYFDQDVVVIGAGSGGLVAALIVATLRARVTLVEKDKMGGDCLNTGCVPSKSLIRSAKLAADMRRGHDLGFAAPAPNVDFNAVMERVQRIIKTIEPHDSPERYESLGVDVALGRAVVKSPWQVEVIDDSGEVRTINTRSIIIASGASPFVPPIEGLADIVYLTSDTVWSVREQPERLVVLGGGPIGSEMSQAFARLGSQVTQVEASDRVMTREDPEVSELVGSALQADGVRLLTSHMAKSVLTDTDGGHVLVAEPTEGGEAVQVPFDSIMVAVGRRANVTGFGLEDIGVELTERGTVAVNDFLQTNFPNIYAIGDVAGPYQFTHTASHMAYYAATNALFATFWRQKVDYSVVPWCTFVSPEVAHVGLSETEAVSKGVAYEVTRYDIAGLDRALADEEAHGFVKVLTAMGSDRIIGATIVADHAGDLLHEYVLAMKHGLGLGKILGTIHVYPTLAEMNKFAASEWRKAHKPDWALDLLARFHDWRRGNRHQSRGARLEEN